ncbi:hypothetical protein STEG23_006928 [Scotinomys teguina]
MRNSRRKEGWFIYLNRMWHQCPLHSHSVVHTASEYQDSQSQVELSEPDWKYGQLQSANRLWGKQCWFHTGTLSRTVAKLSLCLGYNIHVEKSVEKLPMRLGDDSVRKLPAL